METTVGSAVAQQGLKVLVQDENGEEFLSWRPLKDSVFIVDDLSRLRQALEAINRLSEFVSNWIAVKGLPFDDVGVESAGKGGGTPSIANGGAGV